MIQKYITLFKNPQAFFNSLKKLNYKDALLRYAIPYSIISIVFFAITSHTYFFENSITSSILFSLFSISVYIFLAFTFPFFSSALTHLGVLLVKGKNGFVSTFNATTNAMINALVYLAILTIISAFGLFSYGYDFFESLSYLIISLLISTVAFVHVFVTEVIGIKKLQNLPTSKAIIAVLVPLVIFVVFVFLAIFFMILGAMLLYN